MVLGVGLTGGCLFCFPFKGSYHMGKDNLGCSPPRWLGTHPPGSALQTNCTRGEEAPCPPSPPRVTGQDPTAASL